VKAVDRAVMGYRSDRIIVSADWIGYFDAISSSIFLRQYGGIP
jgi:hypothetical protein